MVISSYIRVILYMDDGFVLANNLEEGQIMAKEIRRDLLDFGFLIAEEKSDWQPKSMVQWLGCVFELDIGLISLSDLRLEAVLSRIHDLIKQIDNNSNVQARNLAKVVGTIQSAGAVFGDLSKLMTKYCHMCIETKWSWNSKVSLTREAVTELMFWLHNARSMNVCDLAASKNCNVEVFSDASGAGYGGYIPPVEGQLDQGWWSEIESGESSTWRELEAVRRLLVSCVNTLEGCNVRWNVDNKNVVSIIAKVAWLENCNL